MSERTSLAAAARVGKPRLCAEPAVSHGLGCDTMKAADGADELLADA
jgi:hypothetical protein